MASQLQPLKSVYRLFVEKLGARTVDEFRGNAGEIFYDPASPELYVSNGPDEEPTPVIAGAITDLVINASEVVVPRNLSSLSHLPASKFSP